MVVVRGGGSRVLYNEKKQKLLCAQVVIEAEYISGEINHISLPCVICQITAGLIQGEERNKRSRWTIQSDTSTRTRYKSASGRIRREW